jgi:hypothetical protein
MALLVCGMALGMGGCIQRTLVITSAPEGAIVWLNDVEVGRTPLETAFTFYGDYDVRLRKEGFEPLVTHKVAATPVYEYAPIDFVVMALPWRTETRIKWHFELERKADTPPPDAQSALRQSADELRAATRAEKLPN